LKQRILYIGVLLGGHFTLSSGLLPTRVFS
jgi:hypothetical protein